MEADLLLHVVDLSHPHYQSQIETVEGVLRDLALEDRPTLMVLNKIDRSDARPAEVLDEVYDLFIDLDAGDDQLDFPVLYANAKAGIVKRDLEDASRDLRPLFETIVESIPAPQGDPEKVLEVANKELDRLSQMPPAVAEYGVIRNYLDWLVEVPWTISTEDKLDIKFASKVLDEDHYGLEEVLEGGF